jgi:chromate transport protein ChrA
MYLFFGCIVVSIFLTFPLSYWWFHREGVSRAYEAALNTRNLSIAQGILKASSDESFLRASLASLGFLVSSSILLFMSLPLLTKERQIDFVQEPLVRLALLIIALVLLLVFNVITSGKEKELIQVMWSLSGVKKLIVYRWKLVGLYLIMFSPLFVTFLVSE